MALTPFNFDINTESLLEETLLPIKQPSKTWQLDLANGKLLGKIDGKEAIRQYIRKALMTARNRYLIYDDYYGEEIRDLIGHDLTPALTLVEIPRLVREAIIYDDRIESVPSVKVDKYGSDGVLVTVTVKLVDGDFVTEEVTI